MKNIDNNNKKDISILPLKKEATIVLDRYAIIETGGKQYFALEGKTVMIEKLPQQAGETVVFSTVLFIKYKFFSNFFWMKKYTFIDLFLEKYQFFWSFFW